MKPKILVMLLALPLVLGATAQAQTPDELPPVDSARNDYPDVPPGPPPNNFDETQGSIETAPGEQPAPPMSFNSGDSAAPFHDELAEAGTWRQSAGQQVWVPNNMPAGWRPYTTGHWADTDDGWTWVADEDWGWAPFHYGRWFFDATLGWAWLPGSVWAPAWVSWRFADGYVGWAPLPPAVGFDVRSGVEIAAVDRIYADHYTFVAERSFLAPHVRAVLVSPSRGAELCRHSRNITVYSVRGGHVRNGGLPVQHVERVTGRHVPHLQIAASSQRVGHGGAAAQGKLFVYRPTTLGRASRVEFGPARSQSNAAGNHGYPHPGSSSTRSDNHHNVPYAGRQGQGGAPRPNPHQQNGSSSHSSGGNRSYGPPSSSGQHPGGSSRPSSQNTHRAGTTSPPHRQSSPPPAHHSSPPPTRQQPSSSQSKQGSGSSSHHDHRPPS